MEGFRVKIMRNGVGGTLEELQGINTSPVLGEVLISASCLSRGEQVILTTPPISRARLMYSFIHSVACATKTIGETMFACIKIQYLIRQLSKPSFKA